jgi:hypothetical protein
MKVSGQILPSTALVLGTEPSVAIEWETGWMDSTAHLPAKLQSKLFVLLKQRDPSTP